MRPGKVDCLTRRERLLKRKRENKVEGWGWSSVGETVVVAMTLVAGDWSREYS